MRLRGGYGRRGRPGGYRLGGHEIAYPLPRDNIDGLARFALYLSSQPIDVDDEEMIRIVIPVPPYMFEEEVRCHDMVNIPGEVGQQAKLHWGEFHYLAADGHQLLAKVDREVTHGHLRMRLLPRLSDFPLTPS